MRSVRTDLLALGGLLAVGSLACHRDAAGRTEPACGTAGREDPARAGRVTSLLAATASGGGLLRQARAGWRICFAPAAASTAAVESGNLALPDEETDAGCAARLAHLLLHFVEGDPVAAGLRRSRACSLVVRDAVMAEARAHALELQLRRELRVHDPRRAYPFEADFWKAPAHRRVEVIRAYFDRHPGGGPGVPGFVDAFTQRCAAGRGGER